ncbi:hypothetical protein [Nocardia brasiliensis]|uniref:hypothetical protein n=1 Tax=Nocardia brasiliensis TaxID=37326 RepID=UPI003D8C2D1F
MSEDKDRAVENMKLGLQAGGAGVGVVGALTGAAAAGPLAVPFGVALFVGKLVENNMSPSQMEAFGDYLMEEAIQPYCP